MLVRPVRSLFLAFFVLLPFPLAAESTIQEMEIQLRAMNACQVSVNDPKCDLSVLDPEFREMVLEMRRLLDRQNNLNSNSSSSNTTYFNKPSYPIQVSHNDELFIINGEKFEATTYCFNMLEGDPIIFLDGSPLGVCVSAELLNLRTKQECRVWCE
jgi:hypothetical protein